MLVYRTDEPLLEFTRNICQAFLSAYSYAASLPNWSVPHSVVESGPIWLLVDTVDAFMVFESPVHTGENDVTRVAYRIHQKLYLHTTHRESCLRGEFFYERPSMKAVVEEFVKALHYPKTALLGARTTFDQLGVLASTYHLTLPGKMLVNRPLKFYPDGNVGIVLEAKPDAPMCYGFYELVV